MILSVDIGNSAVKLAVVDGDRVLSHESLPHLQLTGDAALELAVKRVSSAVLSLSGAAIVSVVPALTNRAIEAVRSETDVEPTLISHEMPFPFELAVPTPSLVGLDRLCAAAAVITGRKKSAVVIDVGSAITVDLVRDGAYLGGVIMPGPEIGLRALNDYATQLPRIDYRRVTEAFPDTFDITQTAMVLGASVGAVGAIKEAVRWLEATSGSRPRKVITGGGAPVLAPHFPSTWQHTPHLVMIGAAALVSALVSRDNS